MHRFFLICRVLSFSMMVLNFAAPVQSQVAVDNGLVSVDFDASNGTFHASFRSIEFIKECRLSGLNGTATTTRVN